MQNSAVAAKGGVAAASAQPSVGTLPVTLGRWGVAGLVVGNALEFYDFLSYATFAVYIGRAFFSSKDIFVSLLLSLATFAVGFLMRPVAAVLIGTYADRAGRRRALMVTISLMAVGTLAI